MGRICMGNRIPEDAGINVAAVTAKGEWDTMGAVRDGAVF